MSLDLSLLASEAPEAPELRLDLGVLDLVMLFVFFVWVIGIGFALKRAGRTRRWTSSCPAGRCRLGSPGWRSSRPTSAPWRSSASRRAARSTASATVHYYWIGAIPAMVFLGIVMMPFYYGSKVRSVPEYMRLRLRQEGAPDQRDQLRRRQPAHRRREPFRAGHRAAALLGHPLVVAVVLSAGFVLSYILLGGLTSAIYTEVIQFFVILAGLIPLVYIALSEVGGFGGLWDRLGSARASPS